MGKFSNQNNVLPASSGDDDSQFIIKNANPMGGSVDARPSPMEKQGGPEGPSGKGPMADTGRMKSSSWGSRA